MGRSRRRRSYRRRLATDRPIAPRQRLVARAWPHHGRLRNGTSGLVEQIQNLGPTPTVLANISTRLRVETGDNALIGGIIVTGSQNKKIIVRALGPSLPLADRLADPVLELHDSSGALLESNDNWMDSPNKQAIIDSTHCAERFARVSYREERGARELHRDRARDEQRDWDRSNRSV